MKISYLFIFILTIVSCQQSVRTGGAAELEGYETSAVAGTMVTKAIKKNGSGDIIEEGYVSDGKRNGVWITYYDGDNKGRYKSVASYSDGLLNGPFLTFTNRGQIESEVQYANNMYNGRYAKYKFGRLEQEINYMENQLHGPSKEFDNKGNIKKEVNYSNGKQDGVMRYYNEEGEVTVEYVYKNGEKISGGMVK